MITDKHFIDWFGEVFMYGYGTGEEFYIKALKDFFDNLEDKRSYDYQILEEKMGKAECWFIINHLCHEDFISYGTSTRFAWIEGGGELLREYFEGKTCDELYELVMVPETYVHCYQKWCNCEPENSCKNPLFKRFSNTPNR